MRVFVGEQDSCDSIMDIYAFVCQLCASCISVIVCLTTNVICAVLCCAVLCALCCVVLCNDCCLFLGRLDLSYTFTRYTVLQSLQRLLPVIYDICKLLEHHFVNLL